MSAGWDKVLGSFPDAIKLHSERAKILANNIVNQDTPGFKARDIDFKNILKNVVDDKNNVGKSDKKGYLKSGELTTDDLLYRQGTQPSVDGNTVDGYREQSEYAENAVRYMANLEFLNRKVGKTLLAIKGSRQ